MHFYPPEPRLPSMSSEDRSDGGFECPVCGETFDSEAERDEHLTQKHPD